MVGVHGGDNNLVCDNTDSGLFNEIMNCPVVRRILILGRQSGPKLGMPTGNQLSSSIVGWFCRKRALESSILGEAPTCIVNLSFLSFGN